MSEFVFDTDPTLIDAPLVTSPSPYQIDYRPRLRSSDTFTLSVETSTDLRTWATVPASELTEQPLGIMRWTASDPSAPQLFTRFLISVP